MTRPLWVNPDESTYPALAGETRADVAVIGAGFSGLGAAWGLAGVGADVLVLEARTVASGASGRNAGFILAGPAAGAGAIHTLGAEETAAVWRFTRRNHALLASIIAEYDIDCSYLRRGSMSLAGSEEEWDALRRDHSGVASLGVRAVEVARPDLPRPFDRYYHGGLYYPGNAEMNPGRFLRRVANVLSERVRIHERAAVESLEPGNGGWILCTGTGTVEATRVVVTTNAYTPELLDGVPIAPTRGQVGATGPLQKVIVPFPMYADRGYQYWRQTPEGNLVVGGWRNLDVAAEVGTDEKLHGPIGEALEEFAARVSGERLNFRYRWAGIMGFTPGGVPLVGAVPGTEGLSVAVGYSGHGVAMAFLCGYEAGRAALGLETDIPGSFVPASVARR